jgi:hypothetical protein
MSERLTKSLTDVITEELGPTKTELDSTTTFFGLTLTTWIIIILILALLGFNIFSYLAKGTEETANIFNQITNPILQLLGYSTKQTIDSSIIGLDKTLEATKQTIDTSATGTTTGVKVISDTTTSTIDTIQRGVRPQTMNKIDYTPVQDSIQQNHYDTDSWGLQKALDDASANAKQGIKPDDSQSRIQSSNIIGKSGWCYIGEDNGFRACSEIGVNDMCMSGEVFPTRDICMNPSLRL